MYTEYVRPGKSRGRGISGSRRSVRPAHTEREEAEPQPDQRDARAERDLLHPPHGRGVQSLSGPGPRIGEGAGRRGGNRQVDGVGQGASGSSSSTGSSARASSSGDSERPGRALPAPASRPARGAVDPDTSGEAEGEEEAESGASASGPAGACAPFPVVAGEDGAGPVPGAPETGTPDGRGRAEGSAEGDAEPEGAGRAPAGEDGVAAVAVAAGLGVPGGVTARDGPPGGDAPWAEPPGGPRAAPAAAIRQTAHLDTHAAGSPGAMRSASHGPLHPASRTRYPEIRAPIPVRGGDPRTRNDHLRTICDARRPRVMRGRSVLRRACRWRPSARSGRRARRPPHRRTGTVRRPGRRRTCCPAPRSP